MTSTASNALLRLWQVQSSTTSTRERYRSQLLSMYILLPNAWGGLQKLEEKLSSESGFFAWHILKRAVVVASWRFLQGFKRISAPSFKRELSWRYLLCRFLIHVLQWTLECVLFTSRQIHQNSVQNVHRWIELTRPVHYLLQVHDIELRNNLSIDKINGIRS